MRFPEQTANCPVSIDISGQQRMRCTVIRIVLFFLSAWGGLQNNLTVLAQSYVAREIQGEIPPLPSFNAPATSDIHHVQSIATSAYIGSQSCAASSCHGDPRRETVVGASASYFLDRDKHQLAGTVLRNQRSIDIASRLKLTTNPWQARECLVCHAPGAVDVTDRATLSARISEGVSCESCHGAARDWLVPHRSVEWSYSDLWSASQKTQFGFVETKSLVSRVDRCADCHVGNATQMVNHDLIAAGHPRLAFEFAAYQARMPIHWRQANERLRSPVANDAPNLNRSTYEARNWLVGQIVNAEHELAILESVANHDDAAWPELSQYDCFACHHELTSPNWRQARQSWNLQPGELSWGTWNLGLITELQPLMSTNTTRDLVSGQNQLRQAMKKLSVDKSEVKAIILPLRVALAEAKTSLAIATLSADEIRRIRDGLLSEHAKISRQGWDRSTQLFLASIALEKSAHDAIDKNDRMTPARVAQYSQLRDLLSFRGKGNSVPPFHHVESPQRLERNWLSIQREFERLMSEDTATTDPEQSNPIIPPPPATTASETD